MTLTLGLTGWPLGHSFSPQIHTAALRALGLAGSYRLFPTSPLPAGEPDLVALVEKVRRGEIHGLNVTIPHKQAIVPLLDELSPAARATGAVNTVTLHTGRLLGDNTDAAGFLADVQRFIPIHPQPGAESPVALVLGAGGSARAVVYALLLSGWQVRVAARRPEQAEALREQLSVVSEQLSVEGVLTQAMFSIAALSRGERGRTEGNLQPLTFNLEPRLIVNATPVGMAPDADTSPWPDSLPFPEGAFVYDLVYNPRETALVRQARRAGNLAAGGLGMLVEQAALAFEIWTGRPAPRPIMMQAVSGELA